jgi:hypothetical protein
MGKFVKEFFSIHDVVIMSATFVLAFAGMIWKAQSGVVVIPFLAGIVLYIISKVYEKNPLRPSCFSK